jgi:hypothetical protein
VLLFGPTFNPIGFVLWLKENKIKYSFNHPALLCKNVVFSSVFNLNLKRYKVGSRRIIVFDSIEKLQTIENIRIIGKDNEEYLKNFLLNNQDTGPNEKLVIKPIDYIAETIEINKESGLLHKYNTTLYSITTKELREEMRQIVLKYASSVMSKVQLDTLVHNLLGSRRGRTREVIQEIYDIVTSDEFARIRLSVTTLLKHSAIVDRPMVERVSYTNKVEPYDVHYLYSVLSKAKQSGKSK